MLSRFLVLAFLVSGLNGLYAQLNSYKYFVVPTRFEAFEKSNQYNTSTLVKYLLEEDGMKAVYDSNLPRELADRRCQAATVHLVDESNMFVTKVRLEFRDCNGAKIFTSSLGNSKEKEYKASYEEAIRDAYQSVRMLGYSYQPPRDSEGGITVDFSKDVKSLEETGSSNTSGRVNQGNTTPGKTDTWYAQEQEYGFQVVDQAPELRMRLFQTSKEGIFIAEEGELKGILYPEEAHWIFEYYQDGKRFRERRDIKF